MQKDELLNTLKHDLGLKKDVIAVKPLKHIPENIPAYEGTATIGLCSQIGEVLENGNIFYTVKENHQCFEGLIATGVCEVSRDAYREAVEGFIEEFPYHKDIDTAMGFYEKCIEEIPLPLVESSCLVVGTLEKVEEPDLVFMFCTPKQADVFMRIEAYLGNLVKGYGGSGGCIFNVRQAYSSRQPSFSTSDLSWRMFAGLNENELTVTYPYERLLKAAEHIKKVVEYVKNFDSMFETVK